MPEVMSTVWEFLGTNWEGAIAAAALVVSVHEIVSTRQHNRLSVIPQLDTFNRFHEHRGSTPQASNGLPTAPTVTNTVTVQLMNKGLGPARIKKIEVLHKGYRVEKFDEHVKAAVTKILGSRGQTCKTTDLVEGYLMPAGEEHALFSLVYVVRNASEHGLLLEAINKYDIRIAYESLYREVFVYDSATKGATRHLNGRAAKQHFRVWTR